MKVVLPSCIDKNIVPDVFLAGPIQGTNGWQDKFIEMAKDTNLIIANPRRPIMDDFVFDEQVMWETHYLNASKTILFWLAKETEHKCD